MNRFEGKTALITGGTTGIGFAAAELLQREGARVMITGQNDDRLAEAAARLGPNSIAVRSDAGDVAAQAALAERVRAEFGTLDILFANAGVADFRPLEAFDAAGFERTMATNVMGPYFLIQALLASFRNPASIILNGSVNAHIGMPNSSVYAASKAALISLACTISGETIERGIRVNVVSPGPVATPLYGKLGLDAAQLDGMQQAILGQIPARRFGTVEEIAEAVAYFASDAGRFAVGSELVLDGGMTTL